MIKFLWYFQILIMDNLAPSQLAEMFSPSRTGLENEQQNIQSQVNMDQEQEQEEVDEEKSLKTTLQKITTQIKPQKPIPETTFEIPPRPGSAYKRYRKESELPETERIFYQTAAKVAGITLSMLIRAVFEIEVKLYRWQDDRRRMEYHHSLQLEVSQDTDIDEMEVDTG